MTAPCPFLLIAAITESKTSRAQPLTQVSCHVDPSILSSMDNFIAKLPFLISPLFEKVKFNLSKDISCNLSISQIVLFSLYPLLTLLAFYHFCIQTAGYFPPVRYHSLELADYEILANRIASQLSSLPTAPTLSHNAKAALQQIASAVPITAPLSPPILRQETIIPGEVPAGW